MSFAVNDRPGVSSVTRARILAAARDLGWQPSASARALTEARTRAIGLVLARSAAQLEGDTFFVRFLSGIEQVLTAADYALLLQIVPGEASAALPAYQRLAAAGRVDGFLLTDVEAAIRGSRCSRSTGIPVVLAGRPVGRSPFPWLETRHDEGIAPAVAHLAELGHDRIGFLCGRPEFDHQRVREDAWRSALDSAGLPPGPLAHVVFDDPRAAALTVLREEPTAVICASDALAVELYLAARSLGVAIPEDLSVVGFDDSALAAYASPALTSVRVDYAEFGAAAATALLAAIAGEPARTTRRRCRSWSCATRPPCGGAGRSRTRPARRRRARR